jgi:hypothetical protein
MLTGTGLGLTLLSRRRTSSHQRRSWGALGLPLSAKGKILKHTSPGKVSGCEIRVKPNTSKDQENGLPLGPVLSWRHPRRSRKFETRASVSGALISGENIG